MLKITLVSMGNKMPAWVDSASQEFIKRLHEGIQINLVEIPLTKRGKSSALPRVLEKEMHLMQAAIPAHAHVIALDKAGRLFSSEQLALKIEQLQLMTSHLCFLIGGPEGLAQEILALCHEKWSLSTLTFPHTLARIILLETLYRAWSIIQHHPYHK